MTFKQLFEMAMVTGYRPRDFADGKLDWDWYKKNKRFLTKIQDNITSKKYTVYSVGKGYITYFLTKDDQYMGKISGDVKGQTFTISMSESNIPKGFYLIMFTVILSQFKEILSDLMVSQGAFRSYEKLQKTHLQVKIKTPTNTIEFNKDNLTKNNNRVQITESEGLGISFLEWYNDKINKPGRVGNLDWLFGMNDLDQV